MSDRHFAVMKAQAKLESAKAEAAKAAAEVERAKADAERIRGETERARIKAESDARIAAEASARKTREAEAKIAADKRRVENEHLLGSMAGGFIAGKATAKFGQKAAEKRMAKLEPQAKALAKEAKAALKGTGSRNHMALKGIAEAAPSKRGALGLGASALFLTDAAIGYGQAAKMREQGDEDAARNLETFARGSTIAGISAPLLRWDAERSSSKFTDLKSQATLKAAKLAAQGEPRPEPKKPRVAKAKAAAKPAIAAPASEQKAITAADKTPAPQGEPKLLAAPTAKAKAPAKPAKVAGPTKAEMTAAVKQAFREHPNPAELRRKLGPWQKFDKSSLAQVVKENRIKIPGYGLKYGLGLGAVTAGMTALLGASSSEARTLEGKLANAGSSIKETAPSMATNVGAGVSAQYALAHGQRMAERAAARMTARAAGMKIAEAGAGMVAKRVATQLGAKAVKSLIPGLNVAAGVYSAKQAFDLAEDQRRTHQAQERLRNFKEGKGYRLIKSEDKSALAFPKPGQTVQRWSEPGSPVVDNVIAERMVRAKQATHVQGYWATRHGKRVWNKFKAETMASRSR